jgi:hypothetical protein
MFRSLTELKDYWTDNGSHYCRIDMPCSFQHGDGIPCSVEACAETKAEASESACLRALAHILDVNQKFFLERSETDVNALEYLNRAIA